MPNDFKMKTVYAVGRDWPLSYGDLEYYYQCTEEALGVSGSADDDLGSLRNQSYPIGLALRKKRLTKRAPSF